MREVSLSTTEITEITRFEILICQDNDTKMIFLDALYKASDQMIMYP